MSDNEPSPEDSSASLPEGKKRVRKRRRKRGSSRQTLFLKKREILREMHSGHELGAVSLKEQIARLKSAKNAENEAKPVEERWGSSRTTQRGWGWFLVRVFALLVPVLAIVTAIFLTKREKADLRYPDQLNLNISEEERKFEPVGAKAWFDKNPHASYDRSIGILRTLNEAEGEKVPAGVFRREDFTRKQIEDRGIGWQSGFIITDPRKFSWSIAETGGVGYLILEGLREDRSTYRTYFVKSDEGIRMDWAATTAWSELPVEELTGDGGEGRVLIRCVLSKEPYFDGVNDRDRSWYLMMLPDSEEQFWGYAPANTPLDEELLDLFQFGRIVLDRKKEVRATLRISRSDKAAKPNRFEIVELITEEWVLP